MTRIATPQAHQRALNAAAMASRAANALNGSCTADGLASAETYRKRAMAELQALGASLRTARSQLRALETDAARDRAIIARDRQQMESVA